MDSALKIETRDLGLRFGGKQVLDGISLGVPTGQITAVIGLSGCGKSAFLRCLNRMTDLNDAAQVTGTVLVDGADIYSPRTDVFALRKKVGMLFQKTNPFPKSIYENVAFGPAVHGINGSRAVGIIEKCLITVGLWDSVKERLNDDALTLPPGDRQRLCIARALAVEPEALLLDDPTAELDPADVTQIEEVILELRNRVTIIIATHNVRQAARLSDFTAFLSGGRLIEYGTTRSLFTKPRERLTEQYITGR